MSEELDRLMEENQRKAEAGNQAELQRMQQQALAMQQQLMGLQQQAMQGMSPDIMEQIQQMQQNMFSSAMGSIASQMDGLYDDDDESEEEKAEFIAAHPQPEGMSKYLALGSFFTIMRDEPLETLEMMGDKEDYVEEMDDSWGITDRDDLTGMVESLINGRAYENFNALYLDLKAGNSDGIDEDDLESYQDAFETLRDAVGISEDEINACPSILGWDLERAAYLTRTGAHAGYITKDEAWDYLKRIAQKTRDNFKDWTQYAVSIVMGRALHMGYNEAYIYSAHELLVDNPDFLTQRPVTGY